MLNQDSGWKKFGSGIRDGKNSHLPPLETHPVWWRWHYPRGLAARGWGGRRERVDPQTWWRSGTGSAAAAALTLIQREFTSSVRCSLNFRYWSRSLDPYTGLRIQIRICIQLRLFPSVAFSRCQQKISVFLLICTYCRYIYISLQSH